MPEMASYDYALIRVVPRVERGEFINAGAVLFCRTMRFLEARIELDRARLAALCPCLDLDEVERQLLVIPRICAGDPLAGPIALLSQPERFHWLVSPRSTVVQTSPVHSGLCLDPSAALDDIMARLVRAPAG